MIWSYQATGVKDFVAKVREDVQRDLEDTSSWSVFGPSLVSWNDPGFEGFNWEKRFNWSAFAGLPLFIRKARNLVVSGQEWIAQIGRDVVVVTSLKVETARGVYMFGYINDSRIYCITPGMSKKIKRAA